MFYGRTGEGDGEAVPSCVASCPAQCRWYGDLNDSESEISRKIAEMEAKPLFESLGTQPSVYYVGIDDADWEGAVTVAES